MNPVRSAAPYSFGHLFASLLGTFTFFYLYSNVGFILFDYYKIPIPPSYVYIIVPCFTAALLCLSRQALYVLSLHRNFVLILICFMALILMRAMFSSMGPAGQDVVIGNIEFASLTMCFLIIFSVSSLRLLLTSVYLTTLILIIANIGDYFRPDLMPFGLSSVLGRASGLYGNANDSATFICLAQPLVCFFLSRKHRYAWYAASFFAVLVTFSRGGMVLWGASALLVEFLKRGEKRQKKFDRLTIAVQLTAAFLIVGMISSEVISSLTSFLAPYLDDNTRQRLTLTASIDDRYSLAMAGLEAFLANPIFGNGIGYTREWFYGTSVHNTFILLLAETGIFGGIWIAVFICIMGSYGPPFGIIAMVIFSIASLFSHNLLEWPTVGMILSLYLVVQKNYSISRPLYKPSLTLVPN